MKQRLASMSICMYIGTDVCIYSGVLYIHEYTHMCSVIAATFHMNVISFPQSAHVDKHVVPKANFTLVNTTDGVTNKINK